MKKIENQEQYEKAKTLFRDNGSFHAERLKSMLLEYRRQHNIFEVGDKVVFIHKYSNNILLTIAELTCSYAFTSEEFGEVSFDAVRHAFNKEIKAGKRL